MFNAFLSFFSSPNPTQPSGVPVNQTDEEVPLERQILAAISNNEPETFVTLVQENFDALERVNFLEPDPLMKDAWRNFCDGLPAEDKKTLGPVLTFLGLKRKIDIVSNNLKKSESNSEKFSIQARLDGLNQKLDEARKALHEGWVDVEEDASFSANASLN